MDIILIVDSDKKSLHICKSICTPLLIDYDIRFIQSPEQAIDLLKSEIVKVLISELQLDSFSGEELFYICKVISPETARIAMTSADDLYNTLIEINKCDVSRVLLKPIQLADNVRNAIDSGMEYYKLNNWSGCRDQSTSNQYSVLKENYRELKELNEEQIINYKRTTKVFCSIIQSKLCRGKIYNEEDNRIIEGFMKSIMESFYYRPAYQERQHNKDIQIVVDYYNLDQDHSFDFQNNNITISEERFGDMMCCMKIYCEFIKYVCKSYHLTGQFVEQDNINVMCFEKLEHELKPEFNKKGLYLLLTTITKHLLQMYSTKMVRDSKANATSVAVYFN